MNFFSSFAAAFCGACVFIGVLYFLCPQGALSKSVQYVLSLIFLLSVISAAAIAIGKWELNIPEIETDYIDTESLDAATAEYIISYLLGAENIEFDEITVCTDKTENGSISINKVIICSDCEKSRIIAALGEAADNIEVEIIND